LGQGRGFKVEDLESLRATAQGEGMMAVAEAHEVGDHVAQIDVGGELLVRLGGRGLMVEPDSPNESRRKVPAAQEPSADFGVLDAEQPFLGFNQSSLLGLAFLDELGVDMFKRLGQDDLPDVV